MDRNILYLGFLKCLYAEFCMNLTLDVNVTFNRSHVTRPNQQACHIVHVITSNIKPVQQKSTQHFEDLTIYKSTFESNYCLFTKDE